jgi:hypothetical protein
MIDGGQVFDEEVHGRASLSNWPERMIRRAMMSIFEETLDIVWAIM